MSKKMKRFRVMVREVHVQGVLVDAESEEDAKIKVAEGEGDYEDNSLEFSHSCDSDTWTVEEAT